MLLCEPRYGLDLACQKAKSVSGEITISIYPQVRSRLSLVSPSLRYFYWRAATIPGLLRPKSSPHPTSNQFMFICTRVLNITTCWFLPSRNTGFPRSEHYTISSLIMSIKPLRPKLSFLHAFPSSAKISLRSSRANPWVDT